MKEKREKTKRDRPDLKVDTYLFDPDYPLGRNFMQYLN